MAINDFNFSSLILEKDFISTNIFFPLGFSIRRSISRFSPVLK